MLISKHNSVGLAYFCKSENQASSSGSPWLYTQVLVRALQAVHATTHPAERKAQIPDDNPESNHHNDNTTDTT